MAALADEAKQKGGHKCCEKESSSADDDEKLKGIAAQLPGQYLLVELLELVEVVEVLDQKGVHEDQEALEEEENDRHHVESLRALRLLGWDGDRDKAGDQEVDKLVVGKQGSERLKWLAAP